MQEEDMEKAQTVKLRMKSTSKIVAALNKPKSSDHSIVRWQGNDRLKKRRREVIQNEMAKYHNSQREIR